MPRPTRTFVAVPVPEAQATKLARLQSLIAPDVPGARWVDPKQFHSTLAFLGDVEDAGLAEVCRAVASAAGGFGPFDLKVEGLGVFPNPTRPRVVWVGLTGPGVEALKALQKAIVAGLGRIGYAPEDDRFSPHVTLGRIKLGRGAAPDLGPLIRHYAGWSAGPFGVPEVVTYASKTTPDGPVYEVLARAALEGRKTESSP